MVKTLHGKLMIEQREPNEKNDDLFLFSED
jgi:hypothetical protein